MYHTMRDEDLCDIIRDPYCVVGSDGINRSWKDKEKKVRLWSR